MGVNLADKITSYGFADMGCSHEQQVPPGAGVLTLAHRRLHINLVDPASSDMLVSKIKPCMSQYKLLYGETANGSLKQL